MLWNRKLSQRTRLRRKNLRRLLIESLDQRLPLAANFVKDINLFDAGGSNPGGAVEVNGTLFFRASNGINGYELWKSDGTDAGTVLVKDIRSGTSGSLPFYLTNVNGTLFFRADNGINGQELWKSDGTDAGTVMVKDINSGAAASTPGILTNVNGTLFFTANNGTTGYELWKSDGTDAGTVLVKDIRSGLSTSSPRHLTNVNGTLFFSANNGTNGQELWKSNGTDAGTVLVKDIRSGTAGSFPSYLTNVNGTLFFRAYTATNGYELWKSNGTDAGTVLVKDIFSGASSSYAGLLTNVNGTLFFRASNGTNGYELWKSDGTDAGTVLVKDIRSGTSSSSPSSLTNVNGTLFFSANNGTNGAELWKSDGTDAGTVLVKDIRSGTSSSSPSSLTNVNGTLFFSANNGTNGQELWKSDGTDAGTFQVEDIHGTSGSLPSNFTNVNGTLFFRADNGTIGGELWRWINEAPTDVALSASSLPENAGANATVGSLSTTDPDAGNTFTYTLVSGTGDVDNSAFNVSGSTLRATSSFDLETKSSYTIRVRSTDQGGLFFEKVFTITVTNVNETPTDIVLSSTSIAENAGANATVGSLSTTDPDTSDTFTYTLVSGTGDTDNAAFNISGSTLRATSSFDFETKSSYTIRVRSTDQGGLFFEKVFTITVTNVNETPTDIALSSTSIAENAGANATVGNLSTTDPDAGNTFTYALIAGTGDTDNAAFNISGSTLRATNSFDFETKSSYTIRVRSTDQGGLSTDQTFTITVTNVNESPTDLALSSTTLAENSGANATVGLLSTVDPDLGDSFTYTLIAGAGGTDNGAFNISGNTLRATGNLDFENKSSYSIRVKTQDQFGLAFEKSFTILVTNAIELVSAVVNGGNSFANPLQRSQITSLVVTTDLPLTDPSTAFTLTNIGLYTASESVLSASQILVTNVGNVYTLRFGPGSGVVTRQGSGTRGNSLADGNWVLKVTQATGANQYGHRAVDKFFRMFGDSDGDGDVDGTDVLALRRAQLAASYNAALDWDGNGSVSAGVDLSNFGLNQNKRRRSF
jgi:ELWxxDGT repeat protein